MLYHRFSRLCWFFFYFFLFLTLDNLNWLIFRIADSSFTNSDLPVFAYPFGTIFIYFCCIGSMLLLMGFLYLQRAGAALHCSAWASHCSGVSCCGAQALGTWASVIAACWLSSCGMRALGCVSFSNCRMGSSVVVACGLSNCSSWALEHRLNNCGTQG